MSPIGLAGRWARFQYSKTKEAKFINKAREQAIALYMKATGVDRETAFKEIKAALLK